MSHCCRYAFLVRVHIVAPLSWIELRRNVLGKEPMKINAAIVSELRKHHSCAQDELARAAGLNLRTVQRIESDGTASLQSVKALASALETQLEKLKFIPEKRMKTYEYKSVVLNFRAGIFKQG